jgi:hypothetical protein
MGEAERKYIVTVLSTILSTGLLAAGVALVASQVVIWPLIYEEEVLGAVELGLLEELAPAQEQFLARAAERAALALHTAQSRAHIDELLAETQAQARELALRDEELSAMNEELQAQAASRMPPAQGR